MEKSFKEIYNKRRTREVKEFTKDNQGDYICVEEADSDVKDYVSRDSITDDDYVGRTNGRYRKHAISEKQGEMVSGSGERMTVPPIQYYRLARHEIIRDTNIVGTALAFTSALWEYVLCNNRLWNWFVGLVTDGYAMVGFSPFILAYWVLLIVAYLPMIITLSALVIGAVVWTPIMEFPAGFMNKEKNQFSSQYI